MCTASAARDAQGRRGLRFPSATGLNGPYLADIEKLIGKRIPLAGEIPHVEKENERAGRGKTVSARQPMCARAASRFRRMLLRKRLPQMSQGKKRQSKRHAKMLPQSVPLSKEKAAEAQNEQRAKAAAPRTQKAASSRTRGRRNDPYARFEKNEPRVDVTHTVLVPML